VFEKTVKSFFLAIFKQLKQEKYSMQRVKRGNIFNKNLSLGLSTIACRKMGHERSHFTLGKGPPVPAGWAPGLMQIPPVHSM
jgi:hypothetical protein